MTDKLTFTIKEATAATGLGRTTLYSLIKAGELTAVKIGTRTLIRRTDLEKLIESKLAA